MHKYEFLCIVGQTFKSLHFYEKGDMDMGSNLNEKKDTRTVQFIDSASGINTQFFYSVDNNPAQRSPVPSPDNSFDSQCTFVVGSDTSSDIESDISEINVSDSISTVSEISDLLSESSRASSSEAVNVGNSRRQRIVADAVPAKSELRVLIVEDDAFQVLTLETIINGLDSKNINIFKAENYEEAKDLLNLLYFDYIMLDENLGCEELGSQIAKEIREGEFGNYNKKAFIDSASSNSEEYYIQNGTNELFDNFSGKPFERNKIEESISKSIKYKENRFRFANKQQSQSNGRYYY